MPCDWLWYRIKSHIAAVEGHSILELSKFITNDRSCSLLCRLMTEADVYFWFRFPGISTCGQLRLFVSPIFPHSCMFKLHSYRTKPLERWLNDRYMIERNGGRWLCRWALEETLSDRNICSATLCINEGVGWLFDRRPLRWWWWMWSCMRAAPLCIGTVWLSAGNQGIDVIEFIGGHWVFIIGSRFYFYCESCLLHLQLNKTWFLN